MRLTLSSALAATTLTATLAATVAASTAFATSLAATATLAARAILLGVIFGSLAQFFGNGNLEYLTLYKLLDGCKARLVVIADKGDGTAFGACTCRTADAVYVVFAVTGHIVVDDKAYIVNVNTARHDISSYEDIDTSALELTHDLVALGLVKVAMHLAHVELHTAESGSDLLDLELR